MIIINKLLRCNPFFIFVLTVLFTTCVLTSLHAHLLDEYVAEDRRDGYADMPFSGVYGYAWSYIVWDHHVNTFYTYHHAFTSNGGNEPVKHYWEFYADVDGRDNTLPKRDSGEEWVPVGQTKYNDKDFSFGMTGKRRGRYTATAKTDLTVKLFRQGVAVGQYTWNAKSELVINWDGWGR